MKQVHLIAQLLVWAIGLAGLNVAVQRFSVNSIPRQLARKIEQAPPVTDLFVGNSLIAAGFDAGVFELGRPGIRALNIGLGSSSPVEHDILLHSALRLGAKRVYYGIYDTQLIEPMPGGWADLVGNRAMAYYMDLETAIRFYADGDPIWSNMMIVIARVPMMVERYALWARVEKLRRRLGEIGLPKARTTQFGRADDFRLLEPAIASEFRQLCRVAVEVRKPMLAPITDMLRVSRDQGISLVVIEMPMSGSHRQRFYDTPEWKRLRRHFEEQIGAEGGRYLVASDWVGDDGFADDLHLNAQGAVEFSRRLAVELDAKALN